jgi:hypothetical protein
MKQIGIPQIQQQLADAFEDGLRRKFDRDLASLYREVALYRQGYYLDPDELRHSIEADTTPVLNDIVGNQVTGVTMRGIRSLIIGAALQGDKAGVIRWATEASQRCTTVGHEWPQTTPLWAAVLKDPEQFILVARQIKYFVNQL